jgi:hypothetical protein
VRRFSAFGISLHWIANLTFKYRQVNQQIFRHTVSRRQVWQVWRQDNRLPTGNTSERHFQVGLEIFRTRLRYWVDSRHQQRTFGVTRAHGVDVGGHVTVATESMCVVGSDASTGSQSTIDSSSNKNDLIWSSVAVKVHFLWCAVFFWKRKKRER